MSGSTYCRHFWETLTESPGSGITGFILSEAANHCAACSFAPPGASRDTHQSTFGYPNWPSTPSQLSSNDFVPVSDSGSFYFTPSDAPQGAHQAVNVDRFDSAFDTAFLPDTPRYAHHADWFYAPLQSSQSTHRTATDERSLDSANYFLGPSDAPHSAHQSDNEKFLNQNLGYAHCSSCSPQAPQDPHNATDWGRLAPTLSSTGVAIDDCPFPQYNGDTPYNEQFNNILNDGITDFGGLNNFISSSCPTSETTSPTGISPQPNGAALPKSHFLHSHRLSRNL
ncbi:hypothetical protein K432DRAFT_447666, partial [Lepidopterella palustris CBS 459.81]